jgi:6-pyruvoyltetrahydropterin/6-carboxytetrahydropterin synthase
MFEIGVSAQFEAAHRLVGDFGPATRMHGHTCRLEALVREKRLL